LRHYLWRVGKRETKLFVIASFEKSQNAKSQKRETGKSPIGKIARAKFGHREKPHSRHRVTLPRGRFPNFPKITVLKMASDQRQKRGDFLGGEIAAESTGLTVFGRRFSG
jgi:hypothetical protein